MFERSISKEAPRRRRVIAAIAATVAAHVGVIAFLLLMSMWNIEKLQPDKTRPVFIGKGGPPDGALGGAPPPPPQAKPKPKTPKTTKPKTTTHDLTQPEPESVAITEPEDDGGEQGGEQDGRKGGVLGSFGNNLDGLGDGTLGEGVGDGGDGVVPEKDDCEKRGDCEKHEVVIPEGFLKGSRVAGARKILAPEYVKLQILRDGKRQVVADVKMCLNAAGRVKRLQFIRSSGYPGYDVRIKREMRKWRYKGYTVDNRPVPVCTMIHFIYRMH